MSGRVKAAENEDRPTLIRGKMDTLAEERKEGTAGINVYKRGELMINGLR
jgi:hypothetical protein